LRPISARRGTTPCTPPSARAGGAPAWRHFLPLLYERLETLCDYLGEDVLIGVDHLAQEARDERLAMILDAFEAPPGERPDAAPAITPWSRTPSI